MSQHHFMKRPLTLLGLTVLASGGLTGGPAPIFPTAQAVPGGEAVIPAPPPPRGLHGTLLGFSVSDEAQAKADTLSIRFSARRDGATPSAAQQQLNQLVSKAMAILHGQSDVKGTADDYTAGEEYGPHNRRSWVARQDLTISSQNREAALAVAEKLQQLGLGIETMQWSLNPQDHAKLEQQARLGALRKLRQQAEEDAAALGQPLLGLERVQVGQQGSPFEPHPPMPMLMAEARSVAPPPESTAGMETVRVTVSAQARLGDREPPSAP